jgi:hypothetical protein
MEGEVRALEAVKLIFKAPQAISKLSSIML